MNDNKKTIIKGYQKALKWIEKNVNCDTFTMRWYEMTSGRDVVVLVEAVTYINVDNQVISEYLLNVTMDGVVTWKK